MHALQLPQCDGLRRRDRQRQVGIDLAQEEPRAGVARQEQRVLALPPDPGFRRERHFQHRGAVGEDAIAEIPDRVMDARRELLQLAAQYLVVVAAERVARDEGLGRLAQDLFAGPRRRRAVVHPRSDDAQRARKERARARPGGAMPCHIIHLAMPARGEPIEQTPLRDAEIGVRDADLLESQREAPIPDVRGQRRPIGFGRWRCWVRGMQCHARKRT